MPFEEEEVYQYMGGIHVQDGYLSCTAPVQQEAVIRFVFAEGYASAASASAAGFSLKVLTQTVELT